MSQNELQRVVAEMRDTNISVTLGGTANYPHSLIAEWASRIEANLEPGK